MIQINFLFCDRVCTILTLFEILSLISNKPLCLVRHSFNFLWKEKILLHFLVLGVHYFCIAFILLNCVKNRGWSIHLDSRKLVN